MSKLHLQNARYTGSDGRESLYDLQIPENFNGHLLVFAHGYMGYKDWGAWHLMQRFFVDQGFAFCKFNFSHNGGTVDNPIDFPDLDAFASNSYSIEKADLICVLDHLEQHFSVLPPIHLIGHSRGGGIVLLNGADERVHSVITLASISDIPARFADPDMMQQWKADGVRYVTNQRTKQQMPHRYLQAEDVLQNKADLDIEAAVRKLQKPLLIIHGDADSSVNIREGEALASWSNTDLHIITGTDHVFGASQPYTPDVLPEKLNEVCKLIYRHLQNITNFQPQALL